MRRTSRPLSRRSFLRAAGVAAAGLAFPQLGESAQAAPGVPTSPPLPGSEWDFIQPRAARQDLWGRITWPGYPIRAETGLNKPVVDYLYEGTVLPLLEIIHDEGGNPNNDVWYRIENGYLYTSGVQVIRPYRTPEIVTQIDTMIAGEPGFWAETIVPVTSVHSRPAGGVVLDEGDQVFHHFGSVHRIIDVDQDASGNFWYKAFDDKPKRPPVWVPARFMRRLTERDFKPINPGADKEMIVNLTTQRIDCYEDGQLVFSTLTSSGGGGYGPPVGEHAVVYKQPSRHMYSDPANPVSGGGDDENAFDLPGVPWCTFLTTMGHAIHGTWWHGDFGRPRSRGCLNVTCEIANWLYRWVEPVATYEEDSAGSAREPGTRIVVVQA